MKNYFPILGDILALAVTTLIGFVTHGEIGLSFLPRFLAIFIPLFIIWILLGHWLKLFQPEIKSNLKQLWRIPLAMLFAVPLAVIARSFFLQSEIIPIFMLALGGTSTIGMLLWRGLYLFFVRK